MAGKNRWEGSAVADHESLVGLSSKDFDTSISH